MYYLFPDEQEFHPTKSDGGEGGNPKTAPEVWQRLVWGLWVDGNVFWWVRSWTPRRLVVGIHLWGALVQYDTVQSVIPAVFSDCGGTDMVECMDRGSI